MTAPLATPSPRAFAPGTILLLVVASGCAPRAGVVRPDHPLLGDELGQRGVAAPGSGVLFDDALPDDDERTWAERMRVARTAQLSVGKGPLVVNGRRYRMDCSGVARGIYAKAGHVLGTVAVVGATNDTRVLFELVRQTGSLRKRQPLPGDLVFFDNTYDQNRNGRRDDPLSHVGIVEDVDGDGTVTMVHRVGSAIVRAHITLARPHERFAEDGRPLNTYLRVASGGEPAKTTAELFVAYGSLPLPPLPDRVATR